MTLRVTAPTPFFIPNPTRLIPTVQGNEVWLLGLSTVKNAQTGLLTLNNALIDRLSHQPDRVIDPLSQLLQTSLNPFQVIEGLMLCQKLAQQYQQHPTPELGRGLSKLFTASSRFHQSQDPYIQVYLAGFYRYLSGKAAYGPMATMLFRNSQQPLSAPFNPNEEIGGTMLQHVADRVTRQLITTLNPSAPLPLDLEV